MTIFTSRRKLAEAAEQDLLTGKKQSQLKEVFRRLRKNKLAMIAMAVIVILFIVCMLPEVFAPYSYSSQSLAERFSYPSLKHPFGTDDLGRDILSRVIYGGRISLVVSVLAIAIAVVIGCSVGATAAYVGGRFENVVMRLFDIIMAIPSFLLAVSVQAMLGSGIQNAVIAIAVANVPLFARVARSAVLTVKDQEFVEAARSIGAGNFRIIFGEILPNTLATIIVNATLMLGAAILTISSLSFVGLGVQIPIPEWGSILASGRNYIREFYPLILFPGLAIMVTLFAFNLVGDGLRDALDPKLKQ